MKRKVITIITTIAIILSLFCVNASAAQAENLSGGQLLKQYVMENSIVDDAAISTELTAEDEASINASYIQSYIESNETAKQSYGGCYIDDNGKLHVLFTENVANNVVNSVNTMTENNTIYETCEYTLEELTALKEYISGFMSAEIADAELAEIADDIAAVGIDEEFNNIFVEMIDCTEEKIQSFKNTICDSNIITFRNSTGYQDNVTYLYPGRAITITIDSGTGTCSVGFRCKKLNSAGNYIKGFMTTGHEISAGDPVYSFGTYIGYVQARSYTNNGTVDASFVYVTNTYYDVSNTTSHGAHTLAAGTYTNTFSKGSSVYMVGYKTTLSSGKITSASVTVNATNPLDGTITTKDCVQADYSSQGGDSGGAVFMPVGDQYKIAGVHKGSNSTSAIFVKAKNIKDVFQIVFY